MKELQWANPHIWLQVIVDEQGKKTEWSLEGGSPNSLSRQGWRATTFKAGDVVDGSLQPDEGRLAGRQLRRREVRLGRQDDRPLAIITPPATRPTRAYFACPMARARSEARSTGAPRR